MQASPDARSFDMISNKGPGRADKNAFLARSKLSGGVPNSL
jgi:hypothetical protein